jgi:DNA-binding response OmpR family regulator
MTKSCRFPVALLSDGRDIPCAAVLCDLARGEESEMASDFCRFAEYELDRSAYQLRCNGHPLKLERIPLELLFLLVERHWADCYP